VLVDFVRREMRRSYATEHTIADALLRCWSSRRAEGSR
jgi:hypothetical protein